MESKAKLRPSTCLIIPTYNCERQLPRIFSEVRMEDVSVFSHILFIDNQSQDGSLKALAQIQSDHPRVQIYQNVKNIGLGGTFKVAYFLSRQLKADYFCFFHGDNQASLADAVRIQKSILEADPRKTILGSRFQAGSRRTGYSTARYLGNIFFNQVFSLLLGRRIHDIGSGLNFYRLADLESFIDLLSDHIAFDVNLLMHLFHGPNAPAFHPISWQSTDETSSTSNLEASALLCAELFRYFTSDPAATAKEDFTLLTRRIFAHDQA